MDKYTSLDVLLFLPLHTFHFFFLIGKENIIKTNYKTEESQHKEKQQTKQTANKEQEKT